MDTLQKGAVGAEVVVMHPDLNLALAASVDIYFKKSNGARIGPYAAELFTDTDSIVKAKYVTPDSDFLDRPGVWSVQTVVEMSAGGFEGPSEVGQFEVLANIF